MEKLVITWRVSDYEFDAEYVECVEYESAETFYIHLNEAVDKWIKDREEKDHKHKEHFDALGKIMGGHHNLHNPKVKTRIEAEMEEYEKQHPRPTLYLSDEFEIGGLKLSLSNFTSRSEEGTGKKKIVKTIVDMPEINTLDEWFEKKIKGQI